MNAPSLTLGIEEEYQIIDPESRELESYVTEILAGDKLVLDEVKPELHQSMIEVGSRVCRTPQELRAELVRLRGMVMDLAAKSNLVIAAAGTHPFSCWTKQRSPRSSATSACSRISRISRSSSSSSARTSTSASRTGTSSSRR